MVKQKRFSKVMTSGLLVLGLVIPSFSTVFAQEIDSTLPDSSVIGSDAYVAPVKIDVHNKIVKDKVEAYATTIKTVGYQKQYKNIFNVVLATQNVYTQWSYNGSTNNDYNGLWQNNDGVPGVSFSDESNIWQVKTNSVGQSNQSVKITSFGISNSWVDIAVSQRTSRILVTVNPNGSASAN